MRHSQCTTPPGGPDAVPDPDGCCCRELLLPLPLPFSLPRALLLPLLYLVELQ
jgi:hypothetical protein